MGEMRRYRSFAGLQQTNEFSPMPPFVDSGPEPWRTVNRNFRAAVG